jgi:hypothetical protein
MIKPLRSRLLFRREFDDESTSITGTAFPAHIKGRTKRYSKIVIRTKEEHNTQNPGERENKAMIKKEQIFKNDYIIERMHSLQRTNKKALVAFAVGTAAIL